MYSNVIKIYCRHMYIYFTLKWGFNNSKNIYGNIWKPSYNYVHLHSNIGKLYKKKRKLQQWTVGLKRKKQSKNCNKELPWISARGAKKCNPSGQEPSEVLCWKISKVIKKLWTKNPLKCNQEPKYVINKNNHNSATTAEPTETQN